MAAFVLVRSTVNQGLPRKLLRLPRECFAPSTPTTGGGVAWAGRGAILVCGSTAKWKTPGRGVAKGRKQDKWVIIR